jgi:cephalosporin-C deacetylase-like acetyl esterase
VKYFDEDSAVVAARQDINTQPARDYSEEEPVSDEILEAYLNMYSYDKTPLNAKIDLVDEKPEHWKIEKISFDAAYGNERMFAYLFLPREVSPPYQTIVLFPGAYAMELMSSENGNDLHSWDAVDFAIKSGRAVLYPMYKSMYERGDGFVVYDPNATMTALRDHIIMWWKDLGRSVDYLETRSDVDLEKLCYYGSSNGSWIAPLFLGQDNRYKVTILRLGGFPLWEMTPAIDPINFIPRVRIPVLMLNGRYDYLFPYETSQIPMFEAFGTPAKDKRHVVFETAHSVYGHRNEVIRETLDWLDRYLGPTK